MRAVLALMLVGCGGEPSWRRISGQVLEISVTPEDGDADGLFVTRVFGADEADERVWVELWREQRPLARGNAERWTRASVVDLPVQGVDCADSLDVAVWWDSERWEYGITLDGFDGDEGLERLVENTGSQSTGEYGFIRGTFWVNHPCIAGGERTLHRVNATWWVSETERGLQSPPREERR